MQVSKSFFYVLGLFCFILGVYYFTISQRSRAKTYVIVGGSSAGVSAALKLRELNKRCKIVCITAENEEPYNRCKLDKLLAGKYQEEDITILGYQEADLYGIKLMMGKKVTQIDRNRKIVRLGKKKSILYDKLFLATGTTPIKLSIPGSNAVGVYNFHDKHEVYQIVEYMVDRTIKNVIVLGAGFSGLESANAFLGLAEHVHVIDSYDSMLHDRLDKTAHSLVTKRIKLAPLTFHSNCTVNEIVVDKGFVKGVILSNGKNIDADLVIYAIGQTPNIELAKRAGLALYKNGISVDQHMRTSDPDVYAGGDSVYVTDVLTDQMVQSTKWGDAGKQGKVAASNMVGQQSTYAGTLVVNKSKLFNLKIVTCGPVVDCPADCQEVVKKDSDRYAKLILRNNKIKGFLFVGDEKPKNLKEICKLARLQQDIDLNQLQL